MKYITWKTFFLKLLLTFRHNQVCPVDSPVICGWWAICEPQASLCAVSNAYLFPQGIRQMWSFVICILSCFVYCTILLQLCRLFTISYAESGQDFECWYFLLCFYSKTAVYWHFQLYFSQNVCRAVVVTPMYCVKTAMSGMYSIMFSESI